MYNETTQSNIAANRDGYYKLSKGQIIALQPKPRHGADKLSCNVLHNTAIAHYWLGRNNNGWRG